MTDNEARARELADRIGFDIGVIYHDDSGHDEAKRFVAHCVLPAVRAALDAAEARGKAAGLSAFTTAPPNGWRFRIWDQVRKVSGSEWHGVVVGYYSTSHSRNGVCVESAYERGSVQIYPEHALVPWDGLAALEADAPANRGEG